MLQSAGGAVGMVLPRAVVRDRFGPERAAGLIAQLSMVMVVAPMVAPALGGVLTDLIDWRAVFLGSVAGAGLLIFLLVFFALPETLPRSALTSGSARSFGASGCAWARPVTELTWPRGGLVHDLLCLHQRGALSDGEHAGAESDGLWDVVHHHLLGYMGGNLWPCACPGATTLLGLMLVGSTLAVLGIGLAALLSFLGPLSPAGSSSPSPCP